MGPAPTLTRQRAVALALINQLATPGLGSLLARRAVSGTGQLLLAVAGFVLLLDWMLHFFSAWSARMWDEPAPATAYGWMGWWGLALFGAGWLWALITTLSFLRQAKVEERRAADASPPRLTKAGEGI